MHVNNQNTVILAFVPNYDWNEPWQPRHYILSRLAEKYKVLWISQPVYWADFFRAKKKPAKRKRLQKISESLFCYAPNLPADYVPPYQNSRMPPVARKIYHQVWLFIQTLSIKYQLKKLKAKKIILYLWQPYYYEQIGRFNEDVVCYHIDDEYHYDSNTDNPVSEKERKIIEKSDIVFIHSKTLLEKKGHINKNTVYMPNGVDFEMYRRIIKNTSHLPEDIARIPKPVIGYAGWIKRHLDLKLLLNIARLRGDWSFVLVGPIRWEHTDIHQDIELLKKEKNVFFLGCKAVEELPVYINAMDVCLMPYRITSYTKYIYPLKLHEYLACGKPVVSTKLEQINEYEKALYFTDTTQNWIEQINRSLHESNELLKMKRMKIAQKNSWEKRVKIISYHFDKILS